MSQTFIMLTKLSPAAVHVPKSLEELEKKVVDRIGEKCPDVEWLHNFAIMGPYDYLDVFRAPGMEEAMRVATLVRSFGHAHTEVWGAMEWGGFKNLVRDLAADELTPG